MTAWFIRAGKKGEFEDMFISQGTIALEGHFLPSNFSLVKSTLAFRDEIERHIPGAKKGEIINRSSQAWSFAKEMAIGDLVLLPLKSKPKAVCVGEIVGPYLYCKSIAISHRHFRKVQWIAHNLPKAAFDRDIQNSLKSGMTIGRVRKDNAESKIRKMIKCHNQQSIVGK